MANSKLLKEAIADAKAVKETALANAKLALEEAFTPRLQSMLSQKLRAEAEGDDEDNEDENMYEELDSSDIGTSDSTPDLEADTELGDTDKETAALGAEVDGYSKIKELYEDDAFDGAYGDDQEDEKTNEISVLKARLAELEGEDGEEEDDTMGMEDEGEDDYEDSTEDEEENDDMDLDAIIKELEDQLGDDEEECEDCNDDDSQMDEEDEDDTKAPAEDDEDDTIDLEEILREMENEFGDEDKEEEEPVEELKNDLKEAYKTIKSLQGTINEVNLLNAKLLFANKLFRAHNMTNEQKVKVIETLDRTKSVREVKLVYSTLAENFKYTSSPANRAAKKAISEGIASKVTKSTKPSESKQVISEDVQVANRFQKLAGILK